MNVLYLATRPPWPATDGGRVLMAATIDGLLARGHRVTVVAPRYEHASAAAPPGIRSSILPLPQRGVTASIARAVLRRRPASVARHEQPRIRAEVARLLAGESFDVVHVEQAQAMPQAMPARERRVPIVLRAQNVESDLWKGLAAHGRGWMRLARLEAARLARWESRAMGLATTTIALTTRDGEDLRALAPQGAAVAVVRAPMPSELPLSAAALSGRPSVAIFGSSWLPNVDGAAWFIRDLWPAIARALPEAHLHVFRFTGPPDAPRVHYHPAPRDSQSAFPASGALVVPLRIGSGVRMRILEAWARGIPVVATSAAAAGLDLAGSPGYLQADTADAFVSALREVSDSPARASALVGGGRAALGRWHRPDQIAAALEEVYVDAIARSS